MSTSSRTQRPMTGLASSSSLSVAALPVALSSTLAKLFPRRTYSSSKVRNFALLALAAASLVASTVILHAWLFPSSHAHHHHQHQQRAQYQRNVERRPASRAFRYPADSARPHSTSTASAYSFAQHPEYELGALVGFLAALASNSLPNTINPGSHIDPELVLGFDTRAGDEKVQAEVDTIVADTWTRNPVVIFSELRSPVAPASREAKSIIADYHLYPEPTVFEVDQRVDAEVLRPLLQRLTDAQKLPVVLVNGQPIRSLEELRAARDDGSLAKRISSSGATIDGALLRKKKKH